MEGKTCKTLNRNINKDKKIALTFDMGLGRDHSIEIFNILEDYNVKGTFFMTGVWAERNRDVGKLIVSCGHEIGNHGYTHRDYRALSKEEIALDIKRAEESIKNNVGIDPKPYFRAPYGSFNEILLEVLEEGGYSYNFTWSIDTRDYDERSTEDTIYNKVIKHAEYGDVVLFHLEKFKTVNALERIIIALKKKGFEIVTLKELFDLE